jgi:beta-lactamase regulating signal transducer with metallopeptidase domain
MREHLAPTLYYLEIHLLCASIVCCAAWALTSIPRGSPTVKYWIWVAASLNFLVPLGGFIDRFGGTSVSWATELRAFGDFGVALSRSATATAVLVVVWASGALLMLVWLLLRIRAEQGEIEAPGAEHLPAPAGGFPTRGIPVRFARTRQAPAVAGVLRPHISLPEGIERLLSEPELDAVLMHELTHARRRDNLLRLLHELVLCGLWFHPLVWLTRSRLAMYRELSCDEPVIRSARGRELVSALAKLANPTGEFVLRASVASFLSDRLDRLTEDGPPPAARALNSLLTVLFCAVLAAGVIETIAHTACCIAVTPP